MSRRRKSSFTAEASPEARKRGMGILQVLSGMRTPTEASAALGVTLNRYYQLEGRAVLGMLRELEPRPRGRRRTADHEIEKLRRAKERAEREAARSLALVRASQKAMGYVPRAKEEDGKKRVRRPRVRARALIEAIERPAEGALPVAEPAAEATTAGVS